MHMSTIPTPLRFPAQLPGACHNRFDGNEKAWQEMEEWSHPLSPPQKRGIFSAVPRLYLLISYLFDLPNRHPVGLLKCILDKTTQITRAGKFFILKIFPFPLAIRAALSKNYARANPKDRMTTYTANQKDRR